MKFAHLLIILALLIVPAMSDISATTYHNGDGGISRSHTRYEIEAPELTGFISSGFDFYQSGSTSSRITSTGRTGIQTDTVMDASRSISQKTRAQTTGRIQIAESGAVMATQINEPPLMCDNPGDPSTGDMSNIGRLPENQQSETRVGMMGTGNGTEYASGIDIVDKAMSMEATAATSLGHAYEDSRGEIQAGFENNQTSKQYEYAQDQFEFNFNPIDEKFTWVWDITVDDLAEDEGRYNLTYVNETTISESDYYDS